MWVRIFLQGLRADGIAVCWTRTSLLVLDSDLGAGHGAASA